MKYNSLLFYHLFGQHLTSDSYQSPFGAPGFLSTFSPAEKKKKEQRSSTHVITNCVLILFLKSRCNNRTEECWHDLG